MVIKGGDEGEMKEGGQGGGGGGITLHPNLLLLPLLSFQVQGS